MYIQLRSDISIQWQTISNSNREKRGKRDLELEALVVATDPRIGRWYGSGSRKALNHWATQKRERRARAIDRCNPQLLVSIVEDIDSVSILFAAWQLN
jgi:hypothetical protein